MKLSSLTENKKALINIAKKIDKVGQGIARDENGEPTETYLEYLSLMYDAKQAGRGF